MQTRFSKSLQKNQELMEQLIQPDKNNDLIIRPFFALGQKCTLYYIDGMASGEHVAQHIIRPMLEYAGEEPSGDLAQFALEHCITAPEIMLEKEPEAAMIQMLRGQCLVLLDSSANGIVIDLRGYARRTVGQPINEKVIVGPHEAFNETLRDNLTLLHKKLPSKNLMCTMLEVGTEIGSQMAICYLEGACPERTIRELEKRINRAALDTVPSVGILQQLIEDDPFAPLPQAVLTERPDRVISFLLEGQAALILDGSPRALVMPINLWHLFHAPDDTNMRWQYGCAMRFLRMFGAAAALLLPALFVSLYTFHPTLLPMTLLTNIMQSRTVVPISMYGEAILLLCIFDLINESGIRAPELMTSSLGLVSTLILGTAAVEAKLVSPLLLIVVALSGLGSFALPDYSLAFSFRMAQLLFVLVGGITGLGGVCLLLLLFLCWVGSMESLGAPYLAPTSPQRMHNPDLLRRAPLFRLRLRGYLSDVFHVKRASGRMRRFETRK